MRLPERDHEHASRQILCRCEHTLAQHAAGPCDYDGMACICKKFERKK